jgi:SAM-dependent methyltransferase
MTRASTWLRRNQIYRPVRPAKVNLGSGLTVASGWVNIDSSLNALASRFLKPLLFVSYKFSNAQRWYHFSDYVVLLKGHTFVHHDLAYGIPLPNGSAEVIYSAHCIEHLDHEAAEFVFREARRVLLPSGVLRINVPNRDEADQDKEGGWYNKHRCMYNYAELETALRDAGFHVTRCKRGEGTVPDLDIFEQTRSPTGLYVEARRIEIDGRSHDLAVTAGTAIRERAHHR